MWTTKEPQLTYALNANDDLVSIETISVRGLGCNCRCPKCKEPLQAKLGNQDRPNGRQPHFAHNKGHKCEGAYMTALHMLAEKIIQEEKAVMVPAYRGIGSLTALFKEVECEKRNDRKDLQPDVVGITEDDCRWSIEIRNTHEIDAVKRAKIIESGITCLEIDVRKQTLEGLRTFLLKSAEDREWINNPNYDLAIAEAMRKIASLVEGFIGVHGIRIPPLGKYDKGWMFVPQNFSVRVRLDDGLLTRLEATSNDGKTIVINIGSKDHLDDLVPFGDCDELNISIDDYSIGTEAISDVKAKWLFSLEKNKTKVDMNYHNCEVLPSSYCSSCQYTPVFGKCIYKINTFFKDNAFYIVCDKAKREKDKNYISTTSRKKPIVEGNVEKEVQKQSLDSQTQTEQLPFDKYWTLKDYDDYLFSSGRYQTADDSVGDVIICGIAGGMILVLYELDLSNSFWGRRIAYYIDYVTIVNGNPVKKKDTSGRGFYENEEEARERYYEIFEELSHSIEPEIGNSNDVPF